MTRRRWFLAGLVVIGSAIAARASDFQATETIERGRYLATVGDCVACHTVPGGTPFAGGRAIETPFGRLVSPNLTPDVATGIGGWTDDEFYAAVHAGIGKGGVHLYPALPYTAYTKVTREDVDAIHAYLGTLQPAANPVVSNQLPFPFNVRASLRLWDAAYFSEGTFQPDARKSPEWNRGAYLVQGLGHCGTCHTPKNAAGADRTSNDVQGEPLAGWYAPNLTGDDRQGLGGWSVRDVVEYLHAGSNAHQLATGPMGEVVTLSTSHMTEADLTAVAIYLKDLPGKVELKTRTSLSADDARMKTGAALYVDNCSACHTPAGQGVSRLFPALAGNPNLQQPGAQSILRVILRGGQAAATAAAPTGPAMPAFAWKLTDKQVADVSTYVRNTWGNAAPAVDANDAADARGSLAAAAD